jgi:signal transduction histidine kinase
MRLRFPRSLTGQMLSVLLLALLASHVIGLTIYGLDRSRTITYTEAHDFADRVVGVVSLISRLPETSREEIVRLSDGRTLHAGLGAEPDTVAQDINQDLSRDVQQYLLVQFPDWSPDRIAVGVSDTPFFSGENVAGRAAYNAETALGTHSTGQSYDYLHVSVRYDEDQWVNLVGAIRKSQLLLTGPFATYILSLVIGIAIFAVWLVLRVTVPFTEFARAAKRFGKDLSAEPLTVSGPTEVADAAQAFNAMQVTLRHMIENRSRMLAAVSHDLRTPVTLLRLRTEALTDGPERNRMLRTLDEMESMIASVLEFSKATALDEPRQPVDLSALVEAICNDMEDTGANVDFSGPGKLIYHCHRMSLKRAFTNLIENAVKYGGTARVKIERDARAVHVVIDDDGPGIPPEELDRVFTPFHRIAPQPGETTGGAGLGLSIAQIIVNGHGGRITLENRSEGGLSVNVRLPD